MSDLRKDTSQYFKNTTTTPYSGRGYTRNCMTCNSWKVFKGWKQHPTRGYQECNECATKRVNSGNS